MADVERSVGRARVSRDGGRSRGAAAALIGALTEAVRAAATALGVAPTPQLIPVRVRRGAPPRR